MGFWRDLFGARGQASREATLHDPSDATEMVRVVGESHYQPALRAICGSDRDEDVAYDCIAALVPEPTNPHDRHAVMVQIDGQRVGYLSRQDARIYRDMIDSVVSNGKLLTARARIAGRGPERGSRTTNVGVFLRLPPPAHQ